MKKALRYLPLLLLFYDQYTLIYNDDDSNQEIYIEDSRDWIAMGEVVDFPSGADAV